MFLRPITLWLPPRANIPHSSQLNTNVAVKATVIQVERRRAGRGMIDGKQPLREELTILLSRKIHCNCVLSHTWLTDCDEWYPKLPM